MTKLFAKLEYKSKKGGPSCPAVYARDSAYQYVSEDARGLFGDPKDISAFFHDSSGWRQVYP